jgi:predicted HTH transcriptional regulator
MSGKRRIFISSVQKELAADRRALKDYVQGDALLGKFFDVFLFEDIPAADRRADEVYLSEVDLCSVYIGLFGNEYGYEDAEGISPTEREFDRATSAGKERLVFVKGTDDGARHPKMLKLIRRACGQVIRRRFGNVPDLLAEVYSSLVEYMENQRLIRNAPFDGAACRGATAADLSQVKLDEFLGRAKAQRAYSLGPGTPMSDALVHLNLLDAGTPSHAAVLLFGNDPQRWLRTSGIKCLHFHGTEVRKPIPSHQVYKGTVFALVDQAVDFVMSKVARTVGTRAESNQAPVTYEIPREAVAEAIVNAVAHRDYTSNASVQVMLFTDRLEVWNPGELPPSLTPAGLRKAHASIPRNPLIADPLFLAGYAEQAGTGTLDMISRSRDAGLKTPEFRQDGGSFVQTLWRPTPQVTPQAAPQDKSLEDGVLSELAKVLGVPTPQATPQVAKLAATLLRAATEPESRDTLQASVGLEDREHFRKTYLEPMLTAAWLERTIPDKPTSPKQRYRLTAKGRIWLESVSAPQ